MLIHNILVTICQHIQNIPPLNTHAHTHTYFTELHNIPALTKHYMCQLSIGLTGFYCPTRFLVVHRPTRYAVTQQISIAWLISIDGAGVHQPTNFPMADQLSNGRPVVQGPTMCPLADQVSSESRCGN